MIKELLSLEAWCETEIKYSDVPQQIMIGVTWIENCVTERLVYTADEKSYSAGGRLLLNWNTWIPGNTIIIELLFEC